MDLIEQLGGYDKAKVRQQELARMAVDPRLLFVGNIIKDIGEIEIALLEYRRQHNIFEVGDRVVTTRKSRLSNINEVSVISDINSFGYLFIDGSRSGYNPDNFRHAKDAEIEANRKLEG